MSLAAAVVAVTSRAGASEPASFIARVAEAQRSAPSGAVAARAPSSGAAGSRAGEPASFISRVVERQAIGPRAAPTGAPSRGAAMEARGEPASFTERVWQAQISTRGAMTVGESS